jgi:hypothetical protein
LNRFAAREAGTRWLLDAPASGQRPQSTFIWFLLLPPMKWAASRSHIPLAHFMGDDEEGW